MNSSFHSALAPDIESFIKMRRSLLFIKRKIKLDYSGVLSATCLGSPHRTGGSAP